MSFYKPIFFKPIPLGFLVPLFLLLVVTSAGCLSENDPDYWAKKIKKPAYREMAIKKMGDLYNEALVKAKHNKNDPAVISIKEKTVPVLLDAFNRYKTDNINRSNILTILANIGDPRAIPAFEELLDYQEGINETDASKGAEALGNLKSEGSIPKIIAMVRKAQNARKARGEGARNRPEEDWISRAAIDSLRQILIAHPHSPHRDEAVAVLIEILATTADEQDFFLNMKAASALGDIGDPAAIPILIRGLFMQGRGATIFQQCRVALALIGIEHRNEVKEWLLKAYNGQFQELEADAVKYQFIKGVKEEKIGRMFAELGLRDKEVVDEMMKRLADPDPAIAGFTAISLGQLDYRPALPKMVEMLKNKNVPLGLVPGILEAFEYYQAPKETAGVLFEMMTSPDRWDGSFRLRAALALTRIGEGEHLARYQKAVSDEKDEQVRKEMAEFTERLEVAKECGKSVDCWLGKLEDPSWRIQEKALYALFNLRSEVTGEKTNKISYLMRSSNTDVLKVMFLLLDRLSPAGCQPARTCERLKKIIPYWRAKPQMRVRANDAEVLLANLVQRQGGKLADARTMAGATATQ